MKVLAKVEYATPKKFVSLGKVLLTFDKDTEICNHTLEKALEEQYPQTVAMIPTWQNSRGFTFRHGINITVLEYIPSRFRTCSCGGLR